MVKRRLSIGVWRLIWDATSRTQLNIGGFIWSLLNSGITPPFTHPLKPHHMKPCMASLYLYTCLICKEISGYQKWIEAWRQGNSSCSYLSSICLGLNRGWLTKANRKRSDRQFKVGKWVYLKIQPYRQMTLSCRHFTILSSKYYGPYQILQKVGNVAYKLSLPPQLMLHPTFHVSLLKPEVPHKVSHPPVLELSSPYCLCPAKVLDRRMIQKGE